MKSDGIDVEGKGACHSPHGECGLKLFGLAGKLNADTSSFSLRARGLKSRAAVVVRPRRGRSYPSRARG